jgi:hypothetical protein
MIGVHVGDDSASDFAGLQQRAVDPKGRALSIVPHGGALPGGSPVQPRLAAARSVGLDMPVRRVPDRMTGA